MVSLAIASHLVIITIISAFILSSQIDHASAALSGALYPSFYDRTCPQAQAVVQSIVAEAHFKDPRMAASLIRLHFHDCFVKGCDASILLDSSETIISEKRSDPNRDSARGFEVIDDIKSALEEECPLTVSCADILALAARDATVLTGGPGWEVPLGRRDSLDASLSGSNHNIPSPNSKLRIIFTKFKLKGLDLTDLVALSGSHTIGDAHCTNFRKRLYNQTGDGRPDASLDVAYARDLRSQCHRSGDNDALFFLDDVTPFRFDNQYYKNLLARRGLLNSDEALLTQSVETMELVRTYAESEELFFEQFARSMVKMGGISPLTGADGEIRKRCRKVNSRH